MGIFQFEQLDSNRKTIYTNVNTIGFSVDFYQYLIDTSNVQIDDSSNSNFFEIKIKSNRIPVFVGSGYPYKIIYEAIQKDIATVSFKNVFDAVIQYKLSDKMSDNAANNVSIKSIDDYKKYVVELRGIYQEQIKNIVEFDKADSNPYNNIIGIKIPCSSFYGKPKRGFSTFDDVPNDYFLYNFPKWRTLIDVIKKYKNREYNPIIKSSNFIDSYGNIRDSVIIEEIEYIDINGTSRTCYIIGVNSYINNFFNSSVEYKDIIAEHMANYDKYLKELLIKYHKRDPENIKITDLLKDFVYKDINYIRKNNLLAEDEIKQLEEIIEIKLSKLFGNKFSLPNVGIEYNWELILGDDESNIEPLIYNIRELNETHKPILERVLQLTRTTMLKKHGIPETDQVFSYMETYFNRIATVYMHPLNFLSKKNTFYNRIITLEDIIKSCSLVCDGIYPGMEMYKDLPFWAVCPMNYSLNNVDLYSYKSKMNEIILMQRNNKLKRTQINRPSSKFTKTNIRNGNINKRGNGTVKSNNSANTTVINQTIMLEYVAGKEEKYKSTISNNKDRIGTVLKSLFSKSSKIILAYNMYSDHISLLIRENTGRFYNVVLKINIGKITYHLKKSRFALQQIDYFNNDLLKSYLYGYLHNLFSVLLVEEYSVLPKFNDKDRFGLVFFYSLYRQYNGLDSLYKKNRLQIIDTKYEIRNPYRHHLIKIISLIHSLCFATTTKDKLTLEQLSNNGTVYDNFKSEIDLTNNNKRNSLNFVNTRNNNVFLIFKSGNYLGILDRYSGDNIKSKEFRKTHMNNIGKNFFKFTLWIVPFICIQDIYNKIKDNQGSISNIDNFIKSVVCMQNVLYHACSIRTPEQIKSIDEILKGVKEFICKSYDVNEYDFNVLNVNELSDIEYTSIHIHIEPKSNYFKQLEQIHFEKEFLTANQNIYRYSANIQGHFSFENILDKLKTNTLYYFDKSLERPFCGQIKLSGLLTL